MIWYSSLPSIASLTIAFIELIGSFSVLSAKQILKSFSDFFYYFFLFNESFKNIIFSLIFKNCYKLSSQSESKED